MAVPQPKLFDLLAIETNQHIASYCNDTTLCAFRKICISTRDAVDGDRGSFWRRRFLAEFEKPGWEEEGHVTNQKYKEAYQYRRRTLKKGGNYAAALAKKEPAEIRNAISALNVLRDLIVESFSEKKAEDSDTVYVSKNLEHIKNFIRNHDLLDIVFAPEGKRTDVICIPKPLLRTIQVLLAPAMFDLIREDVTYGFPDSQMVVYGTDKEHPPFIGCNKLDVNMDWVLHHLNFWKYHMCREAECTLFSAYSDLDADETPRFWNSQLKQGGNKPGKHWKGSYAFVEEEDDLPAIRKGYGAENQIADQMCGDGTGEFQDMKFDFVDEGAVVWPEEFERHLQSLTAPTSRAKTRAQQRSATPKGLAAHKPVGFQFTGEGHDVEENFLAHGWLNALPPQQGVSGWQRMTMMKYFEDEDTGIINMDSLWAYEGVVLPGGNIIVGRWWSPKKAPGQPMYSGPFMLWCVDGA